MLFLLLLIKKACICVSSDKTKLVMTKQFFLNNYIFLFKFRSMIKSIKINYLHLKKQKKIIYF